MFVWIEDTVSDNRAKATMALYNLSGKGPLTLKAKEGAVTVFDGVETKAMKARDMNPVKVDFSIYAGEENLQTIEPFIIERGNHYGILFDGKSASVDNCKNRYNAVIALIF